MKAYINRELVDIALDGRPLKYISDKMNEMGINIEYRAFLYSISNKVEWKMTHGIAVAKILKKSVEELFELK
jgi:hypothetical protein